MLTVTIAASAPVTTTLLVPDFGPNEPNPLSALSEVIGAGTDGRTTYVATVTSGAALEMCMWSRMPVHATGVC
jgi:hypothetical protein